MHKNKLLFLFTLYIISILNQEVHSFDRLNNNPIEKPTNMYGHIHSFSPTIHKAPNIYKSPIGVFDIMFGAGVNWTKIGKGDSSRDFGTDYTVGFTVVNLTYGNTGAAMTMELHGGYSRQNFDGSVSSPNMHVRRNEGFIRFRPYTFDARTTTEANSIFGLFLSGLYVDFGYTQATYFSKDYLDNYVIQPTSYGDKFWGYGFMPKIKDGRWGGYAGYSIKRYSLEELDYKTKTISIGMTYNFIWKE